MSRKGDILNPVTLNEAIRQETLKPEQVVATYRRYAQPNSPQDGVYRDFPAIKTAIGLVADRLTPGQLAHLMVSAELIVSRNLCDNLFHRDDIPPKLRRIAQKKGLEITGIQLRRSKR